MYAEKTSVEIPGAPTKVRIGSIWNGIETPCLGYPTTRGVTHHVTTEMFSDVTGTKVLGIPCAEVFAFEKALNVVGGGLKKFLNLDKYHIHMFFRNHALGESVVGGSSDVSVVASAGKRKVSQSDYIELIKAAKPDTLTSAAEDVAFDETTGGRRTARVKAVLSSFLAAIQESLPESQIALPIQGGSSPQDRTDAVAYAASLLEASQSKCFAAVDLSAPMPADKSQEKKVARVKSSMDAYDLLKASVATVTATPATADAPRILSVRGSYMDLLVALLAGVDVVFPHDPSASGDDGRVYTQEPLPSSHLLVKVDDEEQPETSANVSAKRAKMHPDAVKEVDTVTAAEGGKAVHGVSCCHVPSYARVLAHLKTVFPTEDSEEDKVALEAIAKAEGEVGGLVKANLNVIPSVSAALPLDQPEQVHERLTVWSPVLFSKAYVSHLHRTHEMLGATLIFLHNWYALQTFTLGFRAAVESNRVGQLAKWIVTQVEASANKN